MADGQKIVQSTRSPLRGGVKGGGFFASTSAETPPAPAPQGGGAQKIAARAALWPSVVLFLIAFGADRVHKFIQVSPDCFGIGQGRCIGGAMSNTPMHALGWHGGEFQPVTGFFDYVLVWNTGISYGLLAKFPVAVLGLLMLVAIVALGGWWWRSRSGLLRAGLALCIGGALSNAVDRLIYGGVADFFLFHYHQYSFYIFNLADAAITVGVFVLIADFLGLGRRRNTG